MLINEWICEEQRRTGAYYFYIIFLAFPVFRAVGSTLQEQDMPVSVYFTQLILGVSAEEQFFIILLEFGWHHDGLIRFAIAIQEPIVPECITCM